MIRLNIPKTARLFSLTNTIAQQVVADLILPAILATMTHQCNFM
jgi:hypothetical protein